MGLACASARTAQGFLLPVPLPAPHSRVLAGSSVHSKRRPLAFFGDNSAPAVSGLNLSAVLWLHVRREVSVKTAQPPSTLHLSEGVLSRAGRVARPEQLPQPRDNSGMWTQAPVLALAKVLPAQDLALLGSWGWGGRGEQGAGVWFPLGPPDASTLRSECSSWLLGLFPLRPFLCPVWETAPRPCPQGHHSTGKRQQ